jgi:predicted nucleic acid-binding Zn ribbon protein
MSLSGLSNILHDMQSRTSWQQRCQYLLIADRWAEIVGENVAKQSSPTGIYQKVLQVAVSSPVWSQALSFERLRILSKIHKLLEPLNQGKAIALPITDIHFSSAKWATQQQTLNLRQVSTEDHPSHLPKLPKSAPPLPPPENVNEAFARLQKTIQLRSAQMLTCPKCDRPALQGELSRWQMCRVCAIENLFQPSPKI